jgi:hypothetical protein
VASSVSPIYTRAILAYAETVDTSIGCISSIILQTGIILEEDSGMAKTGCTNLAIIITALIP